MLSNIKLLCNKMLCTFLIFQIPMYCVMAPVAAVSAVALTFLVLPINEIVLYCIVMPYNIVLCNALLFYVIPSHVIPCFAKNHALRNAILWYAMPCHAILWYAMPWCDIPCNVIVAAYVGHCMEIFHRPVPLQVSSQSSSFSSTLSKYMHTSFGSKLHHVHVLLHLEVKRPEVKCPATLST